MAVVRKRPLQLRRNCAVSKRRALTKARDRRSGGRELRHPLGLLGEMSVSPLPHSKETPKIRKHLGSGYPLFRPVFFAWAGIKLDHWAGILFCTVLGPTVRTKSTSSTCIASWPEMCLWLASELLALLSSSANCPSLCGNLDRGSNPTGLC